jgi:prepilin-type N-terminal cleavage/methylation domain-containing protein
MKKGFTLIEILIAAFVTLVAMLAATTTLMDFLKNRHTSQSFSELILTGESMVNYLSHDLHWGKNGYWDFTPDPDEFRIEIPPSSSAVYTLDNGNLFRNGERLNHLNVIVDVFNLEAYDGGGPIPLWRITLGLTHKDTFIGASKVTYEQQTSISSRLNEIGGP